MATLLNPDGVATTVEDIEWDAVTQDVDGDPITVIAYEVWVRQSGTDTPILFTTTDALEATLTGLIPGETYYVQIRAISDSEEPGVFDESIEFELVADLVPSESAPNASDPTVSDPTLPSVSIQPMDPPTALVATSKLGSVQLAWDGLLTVPADTLTADPAGASGDPAVAVPTTAAPPANFVYAYIVMATSVGGTYAEIGQNLGHAGTAVVTGLTKGTTYWFKLIGVDALGVASAPSAATSITVVGVTGPDLVANTLTANEIAAGAITSEKLTLGTRVASGNPVQRVPSPLADAVYWASVIAGTIAFNYGALAAPTLVTASASGLVLAPTGVTAARVYLTDRLVVPVSRALFASWVATGVNTKVTLTWFTSGGVATSVNLVSGQRYAFDPTAVTYIVNANLAAAAASETLVSANVFEIIGLGAGSSNQFAELSPSGLVLSSADGDLISLSTQSSNFLSISKASASGYDVVATIDQDGQATFDALEVGTEVNVRGTDLLGAFEDIDRNGESDSGSIFDRLARGVVAFATFTKADATYTSTFRSFLAGSFVAKAGRRYALVIDYNAYAKVASGAASVFLEVLLSTSPIAIDALSGYTNIKKVQFAASVGAVYSPLNMTRQMGVAASIGSYTFAEGTNYILIRMRNASALGMVWDNMDGPGGSLAIIDVGPEIAAIPDWTSNLTSTGTPTNPATTQTTTVAALDSKAFNNGGSGVVTGSGTYTNGNMLYQGFGASGMGSRFIFPSQAATLAGKTVKKMELYLQNRWTYANAGGTARLGTTSGTVSGLSSFGTRTNAWDVNWSRGQGKWITVPSSLWAGIAAGTTRGFSLGNPSSTSASDYAYFDGVGSGLTVPKLRITYQ